MPPYMEGMDDVATPHLQRRKFAFYYRRVVPQHLRAAMGKTEIIVSLKTADLRQAKSQYAAIHAVVESGFKDAIDTTAAASVDHLQEVDHAQRSTAVDSFIRMAAADYLAELDRRDTDALLVDWPADLAEHESRIEEEAGHYVSPEPDFRHVQAVARRCLDGTGFSLLPATADFWRLCGALNGAHLEHLKRHYQRVFGRPAPFIHRPTGIEPHQRAKAAEDRAPASRGCTLSQLLDQYDEDPRRRSVRTKTKLRASAPAKRLLLEIVGADTPVSAITRQDLTDLRSVLVRLPPRASTTFPGSTYRTIASLNDQRGGARLSPTTVDNQLIWVSAIFNFAEREQLIATNPARQLGIGPAKGEGQRRSPWLIEELNALLAMPAFTGGGTVASHFWVPLLALYQGLRMNEACQLYTDDLVDVDGVPSLQIAFNPERGQRNKKDETRVVPLHPVLLRLGILKLFQSVKGRAPSYVFLNLVRDSDGSATNAYSKAFLRMIRSHGLSRPGLVFHSFRHNFADALRRAGVSSEHGDALGGWHVAASARRGYGDGYRPADLLPSLSRVDYPGLETEHLVPIFGTRDRG